MLSEFPRSGGGMQTLEAKLQQFGKVAAEAMDELMMLMVSSEAMKESAEAAAPVLQCYGELVQRLGQMAWDSGLQGLQSVCTLVETNLLLLQGEARALNADEHALLEGWPMLLYGYMTNKADRESGTALLQNLSATWPMTLSEESAAAELEHLMGMHDVPVAIAVALPEELPEGLSKAEAQQVEREMLAILASELVQMSDQFNTDQALVAQGTSEQRQAALGNYGDFLERLKLTTESVGLSALAALFARLHQQIAALTDGLSVQQQALLQQLPVQLGGLFCKPER